MKYVKRFVEFYLLFYFIVFTGYRYQMADPMILQILTLIIMVIMVGWLVYLLISKESPGLPPNPGVYLLYAGFYLTSVFHSVDHHYSIPEGFLYFIAMLLFVGILSLVRYGYSRRDLLNSLLLVGAVYSVMKAVQLPQVYGGWNFRECLPRGVLVPNVSAGFLGMVSVVSLSIWLWRGDKKEWLAFGTFVVSALTVFVIGSRGGYIGTIAGIAVVLLLRIIITGEFSRMAVVLVFSMLLFMPIVGSMVVRQPTCETIIDEEVAVRDSRAWTGNVTVRYDFWDTAFDIFREYPVFGAGPGGYTAIAGPIYEYRNATWHSHNLYLNILAERGAVGFIMSAVVLFVLVRAILKQPDPVYKLIGCGAIMVILGQGLVDVVVYEPLVMRYYFAILAVAVGPNLVKGKVLNAENN